jgi:PAS domain S-box-containing protein
MISAVEHKKVRKQTEAREQPDELQRIADALPVFIARLDTQERYVFHNRAYEDFYGVKREAVRGHTVRDVLGEETYQHVRPHLQAALAGEKRVFENVMRDRNGVEHVLQVHYIPQFNSTGAVDEIYVLVTDITEHQRTREEIKRLNLDLEERVRERTGQLEAANRELEAFSYSVSHDLRAPLRAVRGFTEMLLDHYTAQLDARGQDFLSRVRDASSKMNELVEDLLRLSRVTRGDLQDQDIDLSAIVEDIAADMKREEPREIEVVIAPGLQARGDERLVRLVLDNLLRNAWKFTGRNPKARIEFGQAHDAAAAFFVRDNGVGFDMAYAGRLFGVFQRLHSIDEFPGSGVGLAIVQRVVNRHGGRVWAEARPDEGATFYFTLPAHGDIQQILTSGKSRSAS